MSKIKCTECNGRGGWVISGERVECEVCGGSGEDTAPETQSDNRK